MKRSRTVTLREPLTVGGKEMTEVVVTASTVGDEEDAMQMAVDMKRGSNPVTVELCLLSRVTRLPYDDARRDNSPASGVITPFKNLLHIRQQNYKNRRAGISPPSLLVVYSTTLPHSAWTLSSRFRLIS